MAIHALYGPVDAAVQLMRPDKLHAEISKLSPYLPPYGFRVHYFRVIDQIIIAYEKHHPER